MRRLTRLVTSSIIWISTALFVLVAALWILSYVRPWGLTWSRPQADEDVSYGIWYEFGHLAFQRTLSTPMFYNRETRPAPVDVLGFAATRTPRDASLPVEGVPIYWVPRLYVHVPLWLLFFSTGLPACTGIRRMLMSRRWYRRRSSNLCASCGYDVRATPDCCPECGTKVDGRETPR